ncbi:338_t:CDS:10 [Paraglomus occultum]|uniref:Translation initiation factor eIF2B subunit epsilon n=1 Tax=Paraglomus occultum TaxID=144539 RepID=A0A9N9FJA0_9GLOM|nr:338_t:CDS:10 [Paraglomus occultum]
MPPRKNLEPEATLKAVVLADSFNERFRPLTFDKPRCLLPLCNTPLLEYTLEFLAVASVQEVVLLCKNHPEQIKNYVRSSKWNRPYSPLKITTIVTPTALSVGDALREVDNRHLISSDFILVSGDVVSNVQLDKALELHRARRATDKDSIMTMVLKEASPFHRTRALGESSIFVIDEKTDECLYYDSLKLFPRRRRMVMSMDVFDKHSNVQIRNDLIDCQIDICSVEVPALFSDNYDWQEIRQDFVYGILTTEFPKKTIYSHIVKDSYAARVRSLQTYNAISKDMLSRWTYPIVPDSNLQEGDSYKYLRGHIYKEQDVILSRSCVLGENVQIGSGSEIGENVKINNSVIGRRVQIGVNVTIEGSHIWDDVKISAGCTISHSILAAGVQLEENVTVQKDCLLSYYVVVGPDVNLPPHTKLTRHTESLSAQDKGLLDHDNDQTLIGVNGKGSLWKDMESFADDQDFRNAQIASLAYDLSTVTLTDSGSEASVISVSSISDDDDYEDTNGNENFSREVEQTLDRAFNENHSVEIAALELNTLRMATNTTFHDLRTVVIPSILDLVKIEKLNESVKEVLNKWGLLIGKLILSETDQVDTLNILQGHCAKKDSASKLLFWTIRLLYEQDIIEEDAIMEWYHSENARGIGRPDIYGQLRDSLTPFVRWLQEAEEETEDEASGNET